MTENRNQAYSTNFKPLKPSYYLKKSNLYSLTLITLLCSLSYLFAIWQHGGVGGVAISSTPATNPCVPKRTTISTAQLDFSTHHAADADLSVTIEEKTTLRFPPCDLNYSEYTPCEDTVRSLKFDRDRLIYRERHCPDKGELLKCRVPPPHGYKTPFKWPASRDLVWYANVPHKHLTVEKAVQNWIRFEGDRFRFPGGGTMFPNGADAYIDDIGKLINLSDGSIRTAIDTGCGVSSLFLYYYSCG